MIRNQLRTGYTLLEVLLASLIAIILLAALYLTLDVTLMRMDVGRDQVGGNDLARAVVNRMSADLQVSLGTLQPQSGATPPEAPPATPPVTPAEPVVPAEPAVDPATTPTDPAAMPATTVAVDIPFQAGVMGSDKQLTLFVSRIPTALTDLEAAANPEAQLPADIRRVTYYLGEGGGLCRQERPWVTADGVRNSSDPDTTTALFDVIAQEVSDISFEYYDPAGGWQGTWDGTMLNTDGLTVVGPPRAIRVTLTLDFVGRGGSPVQKQVVHVFAVRAANGAYLPPVETTVEGE